MMTKLLERYPHTVRAAMAALVILAAGRFLGLGPFEDSFITFRCADNFAAGQGLNYNPGEPVESSTCFFFALLLGLARRFLHCPPVAAATALNIAAVFFILRELARRAEPPRAPAPPAPLPMPGFWFAVLCPAIWIYAHSGMETIFYVALLFAGYVKLLDCLEGKGPAWPAGLALGFAAITRMEAAAFACLAAGLVGAVKRGRPRRRDAALILAVFAAVFAPTLAYRWHHYGHPMPISFYVKVDGGGIDLARRGVTYVVHWLLCNPLMALTIALAVRYWRRRTAIAFRSAIGLTWIAAYVAYAAYVGGDYMPYARFLTPLLPVAALLINDQWPLWAARIAAPKPVKPPIRRQQILVRLIACQLFTFFVPFLFFGLLTNSGGVRYWRDMGEALHRHIPDRRVVLYTMPAGALPYFSQLRAYDALGLSDPAVAFKKFSLGKGIPGHEKCDMNRIFELRPDLVVLPYYAASERQTGIVGPFGRVIPLQLTPAQAQTLDSFFNPMADERFAARYELMRLRDPFFMICFVRRDAPLKVRRAFAPCDAPVPTRAALVTAALPRPAAVLQ